MKIKDHQSTKHVVNVSDLGWPVLQTMKAQDMNTIVFSVPRKDRVLPPSEAVVVSVFERMMVQAHQDASRSNHRQFMGKTPRNKKDKLFN